MLQGILEELQKILDGFLFGLGFLAALALLIWFGLIRIV